MLAPLLLLFAAVPIVDHSQPVAVVVASPSDRANARELIAYIEKVTGARLNLADSAPEGSARILVGPSVCPQSVRDRLRSLDRDGYLIQTLPDRALALAGNGSEGTAFAISTFLERFAGVRWLWPGDLGECIPNEPSLQVGDIAIEEQPAYTWRDLGPGGALWGPMDKLTAERKLGVTTDHEEVEKAWEKHNRFGGALIYGGHAMGEILPPSVYGPTHPEYYALVGGQRQWRHFDGKHGTQPCTTNPDVIRLTAAYASRFFDEHPNYDAFSISLNDGGGFCECDRCRSLDSGKTETAADDPEAGPGGKKTVITDRIVTFGNQVAEALAKTHPDKKLILFAYGQYREPPTRVRTHPNLIIQYTFHASSGWNPKSEEQQLRETGAWSNAARNLGVYEYFIQGNSPDLPRLMPEPIQRSVQHLFDQGYRYYQTQSGDGYAINGLNYYILGRLLWNPSTNIRAVQSDYIEKGFGSAASAINRYFQRWEAAWAAQKGKTVAMDGPAISQYRRVAEAYPHALRQACLQDLEEAAAAVSGREHDRVEFLRRGFRYVDLTCTAVDKTIPLFDAGWKFGPKIVPPAHPDRAAFTQALAAWEERDRCIESLKNDFVLSYFWVRYNEQNRSFVPLAKMRAFQARSEPALPSS